MLGRGGFRLDDDRRFFNRALVLQASPGSVAPIGHSRFSLISLRSWVDLFAMEVLGVTLCIVGDLDANTTKSSFVTRNYEWYDVVIYYTYIIVYAI
jgi:hypothetical protein